MKCAYAKKCFAAFLSPVFALSSFETRIHRRTFARLLSGRQSNKTVKVYPYVSGYKSQRGVEEERK